MNDLSYFLKTQFKDVGENELDLEKVYKSWRKATWFISQWNDEYTIVKREGTRRQFKTKISKKQALEIIAKKKLSCEQNSIFTSGSCWR